MVITVEIGMDWDFGDLSLFDRSIVIFRSQICLSELYPLPPKIKYIARVIIILIKTIDYLFGKRQWAAVRMWVLEMIVPPHSWTHVPFLKYPIETTNGQ